MTKQYVALPPASENSLLEMKRLAGILPNRPGLQEAESPKVAKKTTVFVSKPELVKDDSRSFWYVMVGVSPDVNTKNLSAVLRKIPGAVAADKNFSAHKKMRMQRLSLDQYGTEPKLGTNFRKTVTDALGKNGFDVQTMKGVAEEVAPRSGLDEAAKKAKPPAFIKDFVAFARKQKWVPTAAVELTKGGKPIGRTQVVLKDSPSSVDGPESPQAWFERNGWKLVHSDTDTSRQYTSQLNILSNGSDRVELRGPTSSGAPKYRLSIAVNFYAAGSGPDEKPTISRYTGANTWGVMPAAGSKRTGVSSTE